MSKRKITSSRSKNFNPQPVERLERETGNVKEKDQLGDQRTGALYVYTNKVILAVKVALSTGRPLLVRGASGWGKSSLAPAIAGYLGWRYCEKVISSRTQAQDLLWEVDLLRRLNDAQAKLLKKEWEPYVRPGVLWRSFDPGSAAKQETIYRKHSGRATNSTPAADDPAAEGNGRCVVLLDEIDKADPDVPNNLLVPLGSLQFVVDPLGLPVKALSDQPPLIVITTNDERELPPAFLRRCVQLTLPALDADEKDKWPELTLLKKIGVEHLKGKLTKDLVSQVAEQMRAQMNSEDNAERLPSPAEFLDTLRAIHDIHGGKPSQKDFEAIARITVSKLSEKPA